MTTCLRVIVSFSREIVRKANFERFIHWLATSDYTACSIWSNMIVPILLTRQVSFWWAFPFVYYSSFSSLALRTYSPRSSISLHQFMFGSAFARTWTWKLGSVPKWLKPIKTSGFVKKKSIFSLIVPVYSYIEGLGSGMGWTWTSIKGSGSACARTWTPNLRSGLGLNQVWTVHEPDHGQFKQHPPLCSVLLGLT